MFGHTFPSLDEAFMVLDTQREGIPFDAIKYLREQPSSEKLIEEIIFALEHAYDDTYYDEEEDYVYSTPLWYAIVAEEHLTEELIEPTISLFTTTRNDWDFLNEQGLYLIGKLAAKYPDLTVRKAVETVDRMVRDESNLPYLFIYDAFYYADVEKYKDWFLQTIQDERLYWIETFAHRIATLQIKEAIPIIKNLLENTQDRFYKIEFQEALEELETGVRKYPNRGKPYCEERADWEEHYSKFEDRFYDEVEELKNIPVKTKKIGRNEPCPCGSGKKYKKCCLNKDNVFSLPGSNHVGNDSEEQ